MNINIFNQFAIGLQMVYYDRPYCLLLKNITSSCFIAHYLYDDSKENELWYITPINPDILPRLLSGQIPLDEVLTGNNKGQLVGTLQSRDENNLVFSNFVPVEDFSSIQKFLPEKGFYFFKDEFIHYLEEELQPVNLYAKDRFADVLYLSFHGNDVLPNYLPVASLSGIGINIQRLITNLSSFLLSPDDFGRRGRRTQEIEVNSRFALTKIAFGSVKLVLEAIKSPDLIKEYSSIDKGLNDFFNLIHDDSIAKTCDILKKYPPRIRTNYLTFLTSVQKINSNLKIDWGQPGKDDIHSATLSNQKIQDIIFEVGKLIYSEENIIEASGFFIEGSLETEKFKFIDNSTGKIYIGKISDELDKKSITLSKESKHSYDVVIKEIIQTTQLDTTNYTYTFIEVNE